LGMPVVPSVGRNLKGVLLALVMPEC
jgi:hypothetical protein